MDIQTKYQNLCSWLNQNGSWVNPKMEIRSEGENGNGIWAREAITNEDLFNISNNCLLNAENSGLTFIDPNFLDHRQKTTVALLFEMNNPDSFWKPYLDLLPGFNSFESHPIYQIVKGNFPKISLLINHYVENAHTEYQKFREKFEMYRNANGILLQVGDDDILYAYLLTVSRMWTGIGIVPVADLLQHSNRSNISLNKNEQVCNMKSQDTIQAGHPIFDNYLLNDDIMLYINFGFVESSDLITLPMAFGFENQPAVVTKLIENEFKNLGKIFITTEGVNVNLMRYLRLNLLDVSDLSGISEFSESTGLSLINFNNEFKCLKKLKFRLSNFLPDEDLPLLNRVNYSTNSQESNIYKLLNRIFKLKETTNTFIKNYWSELID
jgi:hypothetical protein